MKRIKSFIKRPSRQTNDYCPLWREKVNLSLLYLLFCRQRWHHQNRNKLQGKWLSCVSTAMGQDLNPTASRIQTGKTPYFPRFILNSQAD